MNLTGDYRQGIIAALAIVKAHKLGSEKRKCKLGHLEPEIAQSIRDEERGEQIAKEEIVKAIENLLQSIY